MIHEKTFDALGPAWDLHNTVPVFLALLIFPFLNFNSATFFTKFNSLGACDNFKHLFHIFRITIKIWLRICVLCCKCLIYRTGTVSIVYVVVFILIKSASWGINMDQNDWATSTVLQPTFPALTGILAMSFFIHNIIITVMQSNRNQDKNVSNSKTENINLLTSMLQYNTKITDNIYFVSGKGFNDSVYSRHVNLHHRRSGVLYVLSLG